MAILLIYFLVLGAVCVRDLFRTKSFDDFVVAGRRQSAPFVFMSLMATVLGASATVGVAGRAEAIGFPAFWWLGAGALGLALQAAFLSRPVHDLDVRTLPELAEKTVGKAGRKLVAGVIAVSWVGIVAAQFAAVAGFVGLVLGRDAGAASVLAASAVVTVYTLLGGQLSVVRTDALQFAVLAVGFAAAAVWLFGGFSGAEAAAGAPAPEGFALLNAEFGAADLAATLLTVGGAYFLGPDVISRNLVAKDAGTARRAVAAGAAAVALFGVVVVSLGMWAAAHAPNAPGESVNPLFRLASGTLPLPIAALLSVGLLSALLSSADTCLVNSAAIFGSDILGTRRVAAIRLLVAAIGAAATFLALRGGDVIGILTTAYSVYTPGIVAPLAVAVVAHGKFDVAKPAWYAGVCLGGLCGLVPALLSTVWKIPSPSWIPNAGIAVSLAFALASLKRKPGTGSTGTSRT